jgi:hypothetical protein
MRFCKKCNLIVVTFLYPLEDYAKKYSHELMTQKEIIFSYKLFDKLIKNITNELCYTGYPNLKILICG